MRDVLLGLHRYMGLVMAGFLIVAGLTGSIIAFTPELDAWMNPALFHSATEGPSLSAGELAARAEAIDPRGRATYIVLPAEAGDTAVVLMESKDGSPLGYDQMFVDPVTGARLGSRQWGALQADRPHLVPFIYRLHYSLHIPAPWGMWLMGAIAVFWTIDCFIGFWLTLPRRPPRLRKWRLAWQVKRHGGPHRLNFDLHRAGGLWLWGLFFVLAFTSIGLNLKDEVFKPAIASFLTVTPTAFDLRKGSGTLVTPGFGFDEAMARAKAAAVERGWPEAPSSVFHSAARGFYGIGIGPPHATGLGQRSVYLDSRDGTVIAVVPAQDGHLGDAVVDLRYPLHSGQIAGLPGRILISISGIAVAALSATGIVIWLRKRRGRRAASSRRLGSRALSAP